MRDMSELIASKEALTTVEVNNLILLASAGADGVVLHLPEHKGLEGLGQSATQTLAETAQELGFKASLDQVLRLPAGIVSGLSAKNILLVGVGKQQLSQETLRRAAGRATRELSGTDSAAIAFPTPTAQDSVAVAEGALLGAYVWARRIPASPEPVAKIYVLGACPEEIERAQKVVNGVNIARDLVNDPPNKLVPADFANFAKQAVKQLPVDYQVWEEKQLVKEGFGGIIGVGKGSIHPPRLVRLDYHPKSAKSHVALIGKGITFDSGGLSIKPASSMPEMKSDMAGAAAVLGTVIAAASLGVDVHVTGWLAIAENLPANDATRPSDVITMFNGKTVEVTNTDAEGRLVMADALAKAVTENPDAVLDIATLTGAQIVALGNRTSGVMGCENTRTEVVEAAKVAGEDFWPMPLPEYMAAEYDTPFADLTNATMGNRAGGMLKAGLFLKEFVADTPWAHLDVAGPAYNDGAAWGYNLPGGTGAGVRTMLAFIEAKA